jgi:membrane protease YdiL (CAAX protease family)
MTKIDWQDRFRKVVQHPIVRIVLQLVMWLGVVYTIKEFAIKPILGELFSDEGTRINIQGLLTLGIGFLVYYYLIRLYEERPVLEMAPVNFLSDTAIGLALAASMITFSVAILWYFGYYQVTSVNPVSVLLYPIIWVPLLASVEEIMFRGILFRISEAAWGTHIALLISALIFGLMHLPNENSNIPMIISATTGGLLTCVAYALTKSLWLPIGIHTGWNFTQVLWGTRVSGADMFGTYAEAGIEGPDWATGGPVGIEGSYFCIAVVILVTLAMYVLARKKGVVIAYKQ